MLKKTMNFQFQLAENEDVVFVCQTVQVQLWFFFSQICDWLMAEVNNDGSLLSTSPSFCRLVHPSVWTVAPSYDVSLRSHRSPGRKQQKLFFFRMFFKIYLLAGVVGAILTQFWHCCCIILLNRLAVVALLRLFSLNFEEKKIQKLHMVILQ